MAKDDLASPSSPLQSATSQSTASSSLSVSEQESVASGLSAKESDGNAREDSSMNESSEAGSGSEAASSSGGESALQSSVHEDEEDSREGVIEEKSDVKREGGTESSVSEAESESESERDRSELAELDESETASVPAARRTKGEKPIEQAPVESGNPRKRTKEERYKADKGARRQARTEEQRSRGHDKEETAVLDDIDYWDDPAADADLARRLRPPLLARFDQKMLRFLALYLFPVLLVVPLSLLLSLNTVLLTPLYNTLPLTLHTPLLYGMYSVLPTLLYWHATLHKSPQEAISARICFSIAALGGDLAAVSGRRVGSACGARLGPEFGALASRAVLGAGTVGGGTVFALLCFHYISPIAPASSPNRRIANLVSIWIRSVAYVFHVAIGENLWKKILSGGMAFSWNAEKTAIQILFLSLILTLLSLFVRPAPSATSFARSVHRVLSTRLRLSPSGQNQLRRLCARLPRQVFPILLLLRLPLLIIALRQQIYLRPPTPFTAAGGTLRVLSSEKSLSGQIVVGENVRDGYRFMRCDHSILGGRWIREISDGYNGTRIDMGDSIFATFPLQEVAVLACRMDEKESSKQGYRLTTGEEWVDEGEEEEEFDLDGSREGKPRALILGLGIGITAASLSRRGYDVDIVEIDPAVYTSASLDFGLSSHYIHSIHLMDGARFVDEQSRNHSRVQYDYIIHDVFSGGGMTAQMFTSEFWNQIKRILKHDGVLVLNIVGMIRDRSTRAVMVTLFSSFAQCRIFGDGYERGRKMDEMINIVVFCTNSYSPLLTFRKPLPADVQRSPLRSHVYSTFLVGEIQLDSIVSESDWQDPMLRLTTDSNALTDPTWQVGTSLATWRAMSQLLTEEMWMAY
ncbi:hypothetical protein P7C73_g2815, partial [Tremellales sp. Uapishka_1]